MMNRVIPSSRLFARSFSSSSTPRGSHNVTLSEDTFKVHRMETPPSQNVSVEGDDLMKYFRQMVVIRRMETACGDLYKSRFIRGFCHLYSGQEAVAVGIEAVCKPQDTIITSYRCHGYTYLRGIEPKYIIAELLGRKDGVSKGKGGSMHLYCKNFFGGNGIVGAQVPLGAGIALGHKYRNDGGVCFAAYGDGAANQGQIFEAYNMAKLWDLPAVFVCENNRYGMGTSQERSSASFQYYTRGDYVPGVQVDGMDVLAVKQASEYCAEHARNTGPILMETVTYRYGGHSMSDPGTSYRTRDEVKKMKSSSDPIMCLRERIVELGISTDAECDAIQKEVKKEIDEAVAFAKASPEPEIASMYEDIFVNRIESQTRGCDNFSYVQH